MGAWASSLAGNGSQNTHRVSRPNGIPALEQLKERLEKVFNQIDASKSDES